MKLKTFFTLFTVYSVFCLISCSSKSKTSETPTLYPIIQREGNGPGGKFGYINRMGEIIIQPQFQQAWFFSEGLAVACIGWNKCGYIDETGKFAINPQFTFAGRFSEGLAAVIVEGKLGYVDKVGKFVINPQFQARGDEGLISGMFSEDLAGVRVGDKFGYVDKNGKLAINPQFDGGLPFMEGLAAVRMGGKWGFVDKEGKIAVNPQFENAYPFVNGLAAVKIGDQWGYIDKTGRLEINPQFDFAVPFANEGVALVFLKDKAGYIDKQGKYIVNPQFTVPNAGHLDELVLLALTVTSDLGKLSSSEGRVLVNIGDSSPGGGSFGYADSTGKIIINPQFRLAFPFYGDLALVFINDGTSGDTFGWIDKDGKIVWRETKETPKTLSGANDGTVNSNVAVVVNSNSSMSNTMNSNMSVSNSSPMRSEASTNQRTGRLTTDSNLRSEANKDSTSLGIHFKGAKVTILNEMSFTNDKGEPSTWFKIRVTEYGCSVNSNLGCGKNNPNDSDEGWVNAKNVLLN